MTKHIDEKAITYVKKKKKKFKHKKALFALAIVFSIICNMFTSFIISAFAKTASEKLEYWRKQGSLMGTLCGTLWGYDILGSGQSIGELVDANENTTSGKIVNSYIDFCSTLDEVFIEPFQTFADNTFTGGAITNVQQNLIDLIDFIYDEDDDTSGILGFSPYQLPYGEYYTITVNNVDGDATYSSTYRLSNPYSQTGNYYNNFFFFNANTAYLSNYEGYSGDESTYLTSSLPSSYGGSYNTISDCDGIFYSSYSSIYSLNNYSMFSFGQSSSHSMTITYGEQSYTFNFSWASGPTSMGQYTTSYLSYMSNKYRCFTSRYYVSGSNTDYASNYCLLALIWLVWSGHIGDYIPEEQLENTATVIGYQDWYNDYGTVNNIYYASTTGDYLSTYNDSFTDFWGVAEDLLEDYSEAGVSILSGARINLDSLIDTLKANFDIDISPTKYYDSETGEEGGTTDGYSYAIEVALQKIDDDLLSFEDYIKALDLQPVCFKDSDGNVVDEPTAEQIVNGDVTTYYITYDSSTGTTSIGDIADDLIVDELNKLKTNVSSLFPFCLVFLLLDFFDVFVADPEAPEISIDTTIFSTHGVTVSTDYNVSNSFITYQDGIITLSLAPYSTLSTICRASSLILFCVALVFVTKKLLFSSGD